MLNMEMKTSINSIPFLCSMSHMDKRDKINKAINDIIKYKHMGYNPNEVKYDIFTQYGLKESLLTNEECKYIVDRVDNA